MDLISEQNNNEKKAVNRDKLSVDRYYIYEMIGKFVEAECKNEQIKGVVNEVFRDVFEHQIEITTGKTKYVFREPDSVAKSGDTIVFIYGDPDGGSDEEFFEALQEASSQGRGASEAFSAIETGHHIITFVLSDPPKRKRRRKKS